MTVHLKTAKLSRWQVRTLSWSGTLLWLTGAAWLWLHYYGKVDGEFGPQASPAEPWMMRLHGAAVIAALLGGGSLLVAHVWRGWAYRRQRVPGAALGTAVVLLIVSGYGLYYLSDETWRAAVSVLHWVVGLAVPPVFVWHYRGRRRSRVADGSGRA